MDFTPYRITKTAVIETGTKARGQPVMRQRMTFSRKDKKSMDADATQDIYSHLEDQFKEDGMMASGGYVKVLPVGTSWKTFNYLDFNSNGLEEYFTGLVKDEEPYTRVNKIQFDVFFHKVR